MKKFQIALTLVAVVAMLFTATVSAQNYAGKSWSTSYTVVNMGDVDATVTVDYYDQNGQAVTAAQKSFTLKKGTSQTVVQLTDDTSLGSGRYSAVISSSQPVAAVVNQQLVNDGATNFDPQPPFSSYSGAASGATSVTLPQVMYNWYGYNTEVIIQNVGTAAASDVKVTYVPTTIGSAVAGATGQTDAPAAALAQYASTVISQFNNTKLGAASGTYQSRFFGSAIVTSSQPLVVVVNQHNINGVKLFTYNGFSAGATTVAVPQHLRNWFGYYGSLVIANPSTSADAHVTLVYTPDPSYASLGNTSATVTVQATIAPQTSLSRYDGPTASAAQSDLVTYNNANPGTISKFIGGVKVTSDIPVVVQENLETPKQAGAYNGIATTDATANIVVPLIQANFYKYYTTLNVQDVSGTAGNCTVTYYSDSQYSSVKNANKAYSHAVTANGTFTIQEKGNAGDINKDQAFWGAQFIGSAVIVCDHAAVAFVNEEKDTASGDSLYTFNTFNK